MTDEEMIEEQNAYYMAGYPSRRSENKVDKDEMKNKISMALKDPILQQGFEIICKENAELKESLRDNKKCHCMVYLNYKDLENNLTKAKEIIENLLYYVRQCTCERSNYAELEEDIKNAEQFLKDNA